MFGNIKLRISMTKKLLPYAKGVKKFFGFLTGIQLINMQIGIVTPIFYKILIDDVIIGKHLERLIPVIAGYVGIYVLNFFIAMASNYSSNRLFNIFLFRIRTQI